MANGNLITGDFQWQLHNTLYGRGVNSAHIEYNKTVEGLGVPEVKSQDVVYNFQDGSYANPDYLGMRLITIPVILRATTDITVMGALKNLTLAWVPQAADTDLAFQLPGWGKFYVMGRPRGFTADLTRERVGAVHCLLRFDCPDPTITYL